MMWPRLSHCLHFVILLQKVFGEVVHYLIFCLEIFSSLKLIGVEMVALVDLGDGGC
jgi:hypothetical protein